MKAVGKSRLAVPWLLYCLLVLPANQTAKAVVSSATPNETMGKGAPKVYPTEKKVELGVWDDAYLCKDRDIIFLRKGDALFSLPGSGHPTPTKILSESALVNSHIQTSAGASNSIWLFMHSDVTAPFAINTQSGLIVPFSIPGLQLPGSHTPEIQSYVISPSGYWALLMVAGGDKATWPRDGNRPIYFWLNLKSAKVIQLPIGWDLISFSSDQKFALGNDRTSLDLKTGTLIPNYPMLDKKYFIPFRWNDTQTVRPLVLWDSPRPIDGYFAGLSVNGSAFPMPNDFPAQQHLFIAKERDGFAGFQLIHLGVTPAETIQFWILRLQKDQKPELVGTGVKDLAMLNGGNCIFTKEADGSPQYPEAFYRDYSTKAERNLLDGVTRVPPLDEAFRGKSYIVDKMTISLIDGFGGIGESPLILCVFEHNRSDVRQEVFIGDEHQLHPVRWRRAMLVNSSGKRYLTNLFNNGNLPDFVWVNNTGRIFMGNYLYSTSDRKVQLSEAVIDLSKSEGK